MIQSANLEWLKTLELIRNKGVTTAPRGEPTKELLHHTIQFQMKQPIVYEKARRLSYTFMAAEALWILAGSQDLSFHPEIEKKLRPYSDDGITLAGAYGPRVKEQFQWVYNKIIDDHDTRQAVIEIWRPSPLSSKDIPCTIALQLFLRDAKIHLSVFMRSSDAWMGLPYDMFSFTCIARQMAYRFGVGLGICSITAGSSHLYERNSTTARDVLYIPRLGPKMKDMPVDHEIYSVLKAASNAMTQSKAFEMLRSWKTDDQTPEQE